MGVRSGDRDGDGFYLVSLVLVSSFGDSIGRVVAQVFVISIGRLEV